MDRKLVDNHWGKVQARPRLELDMDALRWTPIISDAAVEEEESRTQIEVRFIFDGFYTKKIINLML